MAQEIVVTSNCQTGGLAAALGLIFPHASITPIPIFSFQDRAELRRVAAKIGQASFWVTTDDMEVIEKVRPLERTPTIVRIPKIHFDAFHPDLAYASDRSNGAMTKHAYNSAICIWAYNCRIDPADAARFFTRPVYASLGYFDRWDMNVQSLAATFKRYEMDFSRFFLHIKRSGVFMHSINHPRPNVLVRLAQLIALKLGMNETILDADIAIPDGLYGEEWPLYPGIGDYYSMKGSYDWLFANRPISGLREFLEFAYGCYAEQAIQPGNLQMLHRDEALFDRVLGPIMGIAA
jgi:Polysaccharide biosynthesis enzyme WcbI